MQIDCHTLFTRNWDEKVLKMWYKIGNEYAIITSYPRDVKTSMVKGDNLGSNDLIVAFGRFTFEGKYGMPRIKSAAQIKHPLKDTKMPLLVPLFGGGFSFSKAHRVRNVKNDPFMPHMFDGEEVGMTARLWTHGYDFYAPTEDIVFHYYAQTGDKKRKTFWHINFEVTEREGWKSSARLRHLLGMEPDKGF